MRPGNYPDTVRPLGAINGQRPTAHGPSCALAGRFWQANGARPLARFRALGAPVLTASWAITYKGADYIRAKKKPPRRAASCYQLQGKLNKVQKLARVCFKFYAVGLPRDRAGVCCSARDGVPNCFNGAALVNNVRVINALADTRPESIR
jgi:hypothetical protein